MDSDYQKLKDEIFSRSLALDYDEEGNPKKESFSKGAISSDGRYVLDGLNPLGQRHPLYLRALIKSLDYPTEFSEKEALKHLDMDYRVDRDEKISLVFGHELIIEKGKARFNSSYIPALVIFYQNKIARLFREGGRLEELKAFIQEKAKGEGLISDGLSLSLENKYNERELRKFFYFREGVLHFPLVLSNGDISHIFEILKKNRV